MRIKNDDFSEFSRKTCGYLPRIKIISKLFSLYLKVLSIHLLIVLSIDSVSYSIRVVLIIEQNMDRPYCQQFGFVNKIQ